MFYVTDIFQSTGMTDEEVSYATIGVGGLNVFMTIVSVSFLACFIFGFLIGWIQTDKLD